MLLSSGDDFLFFIPTRPAPASPCPYTILKHSRRKVIPIGLTRNFRFQLYFCTEPYGSRPSPVHLRSPWRWNGASLPARAGQTVVWALHASSFPFLMRIRPGGRLFRGIPLRRVSRWFRGTSSALLLRIRELCFGAARAVVNSMLANNCLEVAMNRLFGRLTSLLLVLLAGPLVGHAQEIAPLPITPGPAALEKLARLTPSPGQEFGSFRPPEPMDLFPASRPCRPVDPAVRRAILRNAAGFPSRPVQVTLLDGRKLEGKVHRKSAVLFELRTRNPKGRESIRFADVASVRIGSLNAGERVVEGLEITGAIALMIAASPLFFLGAASCGFQCS
jgi:hypothetical protein